MRRLLSLLLVLVLAVTSALTVISIQPAAAFTPWVQWTKTWTGGYEDSGRGVAVDSSGNITVTGFAGTNVGDCAGPFSGSAVFLLKFDSSGGLLWQKTWDGSGHDDGEDVAVDASGNIYVTGHTFRGFGTGNYDALLLKFNSTGGLVWQKTWGGRGSDSGYGVAVDPAGNIYITGATNSFLSGNYDVFLLELSSAGSLLDQEIYGGSGVNVGFGVVVG